MDSFEASKLLFLCPLVFKLLLCSNVLCFWIFLLVSVKRFANHKPLIFACDDFTPGKLFLTTFIFLVSWSHFLILWDSVTSFCTSDTTIYWSLMSIRVRGSTRKACFDAVSLPNYCLLDFLQLSKFFNFSHFSAHFSGEKLCRVDHQFWSLQVSNEKSVKETFKLSSKTRIFHIINSY